MSAGSDDNKTNPDVSHEQPKAEAAAETPSAETPKVEAPKVEAPQLAAAEPRIETVPATAAAAPRGRLALRAKRFTPLAAAIALSAALGAMAGSLAATSLVRVGAPAAPAEDIATKQSVAALENELAALRAGVETAGQTASVQFARIADRLDRGERAQAEPLTRLAKIGESLARIERSAAPAANANDTTGTVPARVASAEPPRQGPEILGDWNIRRARNGIALIQGRRGLVEIETGDSIPGLGRIEEIRRRDGRWVVVTSRGLIVER